MKIIKTHLHLSVALTVGLATMFFWGAIHPEMLSWQEQNQLFLLTSDYLLEHLAVAGGWADYLGEAIIQFCFYPWAGALLIALVAMAEYAIAARLCRTLRLWSKGADGGSLAIEAGTALCICLLTLWTMADHETMFGYVVALTLSMLGTWAIAAMWRRLDGRRPWLRHFVTLLALPCLYWLCGPVAVIAAGIVCLCCLLGSGSRLKAISIALGYAIWAAVSLMLMRQWFLAQYPYGTVLLGINYYRATLLSVSAPALLSLMYPAVVLMLVLAASLPQRIGSAVAGCLSGVALICALTSFDADVTLLLRECQAVRKGDWKGVLSLVDESRKHDRAALLDPASLTSQNLALAMEGRLATDIFRYPQRGLSGLLQHRQKDNFSNISTMEAFWQLGFINESQRYAFDIQESIPNCRKSGRFTLRLAECHLVNGRYEVADKYLDLLAHSLFYAPIAQRVRSYCGNEEMINHHPVWGKKRQQRLRADFLYYYPEMHKMLGQLLMQDRTNKLAYDYYMSSLILQGKQDSFVASLPHQPAPGQDPFPPGYHDYVNWMQQHALTAPDAESGASPQLR